MKYSKLPQWMRDKIFLEPGGEVTIVFRYDGGLLGYWRNVGIIADIMGRFSRLLSFTGVYGLHGSYFESVDDCNFGTVILSDFTGGSRPLAEEIDYCLERLTLHGVFHSSYATVAGFVFNGKNIVDKLPAVLPYQSLAHIGLYDENWVIDWLYRNRQAQSYNRYDWPYYYVAGCDCDDDDDYYDD